MKNKNFIILIIFFIFTLYSFFIAGMGNSYAAVGQSYNSMVNSYGQPVSVPLSKAVSRKNLQKYETKGVSVSSYKFIIRGFKMIAMFNSNNVCYEMKTYGNRTLPPVKYLVGPALASVKPAVLKRVWLRSIILEYGSGSSAVIYESYGMPGDLSAKVYSPSLKP
ncbi:MAG: hypothetical protein ACYCSQ_02355 [bacterium]